MADGDAQFIVDNPVHVEGGGGGLALPLVVRDERETLNRHFSLCSWFGHESCPAGFTIFLINHSTATRHYCSLSAIEQLSWL